MRKDYILTQEHFSALIKWLGPDEEQAGTKYEHIRRSLVDFFRWQKRCDAEDLADETIDRVTKRLPEIIAGYKGDPALYFLGVARRLLLEKRRLDPHRDESKSVESVAHTDRNTDNSEEYNRKHDCLDECMRKLSAESRRLILDYYEWDKRAKIDSRRELARRMGMELENLRVKIFRIRSSLHNCIDKCLDKMATLQ